MWRVLHSEWCDREVNVSRVCLHQMDLEILSWRPRFSLHLRATWDTFIRDWDKATEAMEWEGLFKFEFFAVAWLSWKQRRNIGNLNCQTQGKIKIYQWTPQTKKNTKWSQLWNSWICCCSEQERKQKMRRVAWGETRKGEPAAAMWPSLFFKLPVHLGDNIDSVKISAAKRLLASMTWMSDPVSKWRTRGKEISGFTTEWMWPQKNVSFVLAINMSTQLRRHKHDQTNIYFPAWILKEQGK